MFTRDASSKPGRAEQDRRKQEVVKEGEVINVASCERMQGQGAQLGCRKSEMGRGCWLDMDESRSSVMDGKTWGKI